MARPPANRPASNPPADEPKLHLHFDDPMQEILFLLGQLNGNHTATAHRITELVLIVQRDWKAELAAAEKVGE